MNMLPGFLIAAGLCWIPSEILEVTAGGRTTLTLGLTAAFHLFMSAGIWGAYAGERNRRSRFSRTATIITSAGFLLLVYPPIAVAITPSETIMTFMQSRPLFGAAGVLATIGTMLFGIAVLRHGSYARWIGIALVACPPVFTGLMLMKGPILPGIGANIVEGVALIAMGVRAGATLGDPLLRTA